MYIVYETTNVEHFGNSTNIVYWVKNTSNDEWYFIDGVNKVHKAYYKPSKFWGDYWILHSNQYTQAEIITKFPEFLNL